MQEVVTVGLDLAKQVFQAHGADAEGMPLFNRKLRRAEVLRFFEKLPRCLVGMEACSGAHYWAREIAALGHDVKLIPPAYVTPFVKRGKTDAVDAEAISEAVSRKTMRFVPIKTAEQQAAAMMLKTRVDGVRPLAGPRISAEKWRLVPHDRSDGCADSLDCQLLERVIARADVRSLASATTAPRQLLTVQTVRRQRGAASLKRR